MTQLKSILACFLISLTLNMAMPTPSFARTDAALANLNAPFEGGETTAGNFLAAIIAGSTQDIGPAAHYYAEALKSEPKDKDILNRAVLTALADGKMSEAFRFSERILAKDPKNPLANLALGVRSIKQHQFARARVYINHSAGKFVNLDPLSALLTAWTYVGEGQVNKGIALADKLNDLSVIELRQYMSALMADISGKSGEALKRMANAYNLDKNNITGAESYARMEARLGDKNIAQKVLEEALLIAPNDPQIIVPLAEIKADKIPEPLVKSAVEGAAEVFYFQAGARAKPGEEILVLIYMQMAHFLNPESDRIEFSIGEAFAGLNQHERAITYFNSLGEKSIFYRRAMIRKAFSLENSEKSDEAIVTLKKLTDAQPKDLEALNSLGILLRVKKHWAEAIAANTKAIDLISKDANGKPSAAYWSLYQGRGICYERNTEW